MAAPRTLVRGRPAHEAMVWVLREPLLLRPHLVRSSAAAARLWVVAWFCRCHEVADAIRSPPPLWQWGSKRWWQRCHGWLPCCGERGSKPRKVMCVAPVRANTGLSCACGGGMPAAARCDGEDERVAQCTGWVNTACASLGWVVTYGQPDPISYIHKKRKIKNWRKGGREWN